MGLGIKDIVTGIFKPAKELVSELITDKDQRDRLLAQLDQAQIALESVLIQERSAVIQAEAKSQSWITRNWRPLTMLTFVGLVVGRWTGLTVDVPPEVEVELMQMIKLGLTGYVVGRSAEKIAPGLITALTGKGKD